MYVSHNASPESSTPSKLMIKLQARMAIQAIKALRDVGASHPSPWLNGPLGPLAH